MTVLANFWLGYLWGLVTLPALAILVVFGLFLFALVVTLLRRNRLDRTIHEAHKYAQRNNKDEPFDETP